MADPEPSAFWRKCSSCRKPIGFKQPFWVCSVSTCNRVRTGLAFCSVTCFDAHIPIFNHRDSGAFERMSPLSAEAKADAPSAVRSQPAASPGAPETDEILVVVSKVKKYIRDRSGMSTSDAVMDTLSRRVRQWAEVAIRCAKTNGRQTVMERDVD